MKKFGEVIKDKDTGLQYIVSQEEQDGYCLGCAFRPPEMKSMCFKNNQCKGIVYKEFKKGE